MAPDTGAIASDAGAVAADAGTVSMDAGVVHSDAGAVITDAGHSPLDASERDAGRMPASDAGSAPRDTGTMEPTCESGFELIDGRCSDIDECSAQTDDCTTMPAAKCVNDPGSFHCECPTGYEGDGKGSAGCTETDECSTGAHDCDTAPNACVNTPGSYQCTCPSGYDGSGRGARGCIDRDDCANDPCGAGASGCTDNGPNSYVCTCRQGYTGAGTRTCTDIDECQQSFSCNADYACINRVPGYMCLGQFADWHIPDVEAGSLTDTSYSPSPDGSTIRDNVTRLVWEAKPPTFPSDTCAEMNGCTWYEAQRYCEMLPLGGQTDWRLPSKIELESLLDFTQTNPSADPIFGKYTSYFWTSQTHPNIPENSWLVYFTYGDTVSFSKDSRWSMRCVRGGQ